MINHISLEAHNLDDAWFQCLSSVMDHGRIYKIDKGSYQGQCRLEFDFLTCKINNPGQRPLAPIMPEGTSIPPPTTDEYIHDYFANYLMDGKGKTQEEHYTYAERLVNPIIRLGGKYSPVENTVLHTASGSTRIMTSEIVTLETGLNPVQHVIDEYKKHGHGTNRLCMTVGMPMDVYLEHSPCLREVDTRILDGRLHFFILYRSWDLISGFPTNLGGLQLLKEYMAQEIGVEDGIMIVASKGLHLYDHFWDLAEARTGKKIKRDE